MIDAHGSLKRLRVAIVAAGVLLMQVRMPCQLQPPATPGPRVATSASTIGPEQDATCQPSWLPTFGAQPGVDGTDAAVDALAVFDDGSGPALYLAGTFEYAGGLPAMFIAKWDGTSWSALGSGMVDVTGFEGSVVALAVFDDGSGPALYAGGNFVYAGGVSAYNIAKWNGTAWSPLGTGVNHSVSALAVFDDGSGPALYAGGYFTIAGGVAASHIAKWNGTSWSPLGSGLGSETGGPSPTVYALTVFDDGSGPALYAGGNFTTAGGVPASAIAKWSGASWSALGSGIGGQIGGYAEVDAMAVFDDGSGPALFTGGYFLTAGGVSAPYLAKWNGTSWSALASGVGGWVHALTVFDDGSGPALYAGGAFATAGSVLVNNIAKWNGTSWSALGSGVDDYAVEALAVFDDGSGPALYVSGYFTTAGGGFQANFIAKWDGSGWSKLGEGLNTGADVLTVFDDGSGPALYAGGYFTKAGGATAKATAKWNGQGWSALGGGMAGGSGAAAPRVNDLAVFDDGSGPALYAGGNFSSAGGVPASGVAKWDGASWSALGDGVKFGTALGVVSAFTVFDDGSGPALYVGGDFKTAGGVPANFIARWDGTSWSALGSGTNGTVDSLAVFDDGSGPALYVGGGFYIAGGVPAYFIAKWDGSTWSALDQGLPGTYPGVWTLEVFDDGSGPALFAGGRFTSLAGSMPLNHIAKWDGTSWSAVGSGMVGFGLFDLTTFDDGSGPALFAGGDFSSAPDSGDANIAKWGGCPAAPPIWTDLGFGLAGVAGVPQLSGFGKLLAGSSGSLQLVDAAPLAPALLVLSTFGTPTPFKGGTLVPVPILFSPLLATDLQGDQSVPWTAAPSGLSGLSLFFQCAIHDGVAVKGVALSNALRGDVP